MHFSYASPFEAMCSTARRLISAKVLGRVRKSDLIKDPGRTCTVPYPGVDKVKVKVSVKVKVNIRRRLGEAMPRASITKARRRQEEASPR